MFGRYLCCWTLLVCLAVVKLFESAGPGYRELCPWCWFCDGALAVNGPEFAKYEVDEL